MSRNAGKRFLEGFQPNFSNMFDMSFKLDQINKEKQRQEQELLKSQKEQSDILNQLTNGKLQNGSYRGKFTPLDLSLTPQDQTNLIGRANDDTLQRYKLISEMNKPKENKYLAPNLDQDNKYITQWNETTRQMETTDQPNPNYKPEETTTWEYKPANTFAGLEDYPPDYKMKITKKGNKVVEQTILPTFKQQKIDVNINQPYTQLSPYARQTLQDYVKEIDGYNRLLTQKPDPTTNKITILDKFGVPDKSVPPEGIKKAKQNAIDAMKSYLDNNGGQGVDDYNVLKNTLGTNPKSLWQTIFKAYTKDLKDEKDDAWFETAKYKFYIDFGYDPVGEYHLGGTIKTEKK